MSGAASARIGWPGNKFAAFIDEEDARAMMRALAYDLAKETYRLDR